jgi:hypothetical protein
MGVRGRALPIAAGLVLSGLLIMGLAVRHDTARERESVAFPSQRAALVTMMPTVIPRPTVTPGPTETPASLPASHLRTGGISYVMSDLQTLQAAADRGEAPYALDPVRVTVHDLPRYGFTPGPIEVIAPPAPHVAPTAHTGEDGLPETDVIVRYGGRQYWIVLNQFIRHGPGGIWSIITITPMQAGS